MSACQNCQHPLGDDADAGCARAGIAIHRACADTLRDTLHHDVATTRSAFELAWRVVRAAPRRHDRTCRFATHHYAKPFRAV